MAHLIAWLQSLEVREDEGQGMVEYALILVLVSVVAMAVLFLLGGAVTNVFQSVVNSLT